MPAFLITSEGIIYPDPPPESKRGIPWVTRFLAVERDTMPGNYLLSRRSLMVGDFCYTNRGQIIEVTKIIERK